MDFEPRRLVRPCERPQRTRERQIEPEREHRQNRVRATRPLPQLLHKRFTHTPFGRKAHGERFYFDWNAVHNSEVWKRCEAHINLYRKRFFTTAQAVTDETQVWHVFVTPCRRFLVLPILLCSRSCLSPAFHAKPARYCSSLLHFITTLFPWCITVSLMLACMCV